MDHPYNALTQNSYSGKNVDTLCAAAKAHGYTDPRWLTFRQALKLGLCVRKGEKAPARVIKVVTGPAPRDDDGKGRKRRQRAGLRSYSVFNMEQTAPLAKPPSIEDDKPTTYTLTPKVHPGWGHAEGIGAGGHRNS